MKTQKISITQFVKFMEIVTKFKVNAPEKVGFALRPIIEDIIFDIKEANEIVTQRIYEAVKNALRISSIDTAKAIVNDYVLWLKKDRKNMISEAIDIDIEWDEFDLDEVDLLDDEFYDMNEQRARAPKLKGRDLKKRKAKSEIMSKLNKDEQFKEAKRKLLNVASRTAKKIARDAGIPPNLVDVSKIIVRKDD